MSDNNNNVKAKYSDLKGVHKAVPIILGGVAVFLAVCLVIPTIMGAAGQAIGGLLRGLFSFGSYLIPIALAMHAIFYPGDLEDKKIKKRAIFSAVSLVLITCIEYAIYYWGKEVVFSPADGFVNANGGGFVGGVLGFLLSFMFGQLGVIIICAVALAIYAVFYFAEKAGSIGQAALNVAAAIKKLIIFIDDKNQERKEKKRQLKEEEDQHQRELASEELIDDEFFKARGEASSIKIRQLGIEEDADSNGTSPLIDPAIRIPQEPEVIVTEEPERRRRRSSDKPLDLDYGIETEPEVVEEAPEELKEEDEPKFNNAFFGLDDRADAVFTKSFDPFDFATSEKNAAKYANRVSTKANVTDELDEMRIAEMKADHEPSERERRMMELERKKKEWMRQNRRPEPTPAPAPVVEQTAPAEPTPAPAPVSIPTPAPTVAAPSPVEHAEVHTPTVSTYSSYSNTKTTYSQPIKTVEFTITKEPKNAPSAPIESGEVSYSFDKSAHSEEAAEDVAILISQRIAKNNPAYARSANDLKTYTKVVSDQDDELYRQLQGISTPAPVAEESVDTIPTEDAPVLENTETVTADDSLVLEPADNLSAEVKQNSDIWDLEDDDDELTLSDDAAESAAENTTTEPVAESKALPEENEEPTLAEEPIIANSVEPAAENDQPDADEPSVQSTYQRAANFVSNMVNEPVAAPEIRPYTAPAQNDGVVDAAPAVIGMPLPGVPAVPVAPAIPVVPTIPVAPAPAIQAMPVPEVPAVPVVEAHVEPDPEQVAPAEPVASAVPVVAEPAVIAESLFSVVDGDEDNVATTSAAPVIEEESSPAVEVSFADEDEDILDDEDEDIDEEEAEEPEEDVFTEEIPPEEQNPDVNEMRKMFPFLAPLSEQKPTAKPQADLRDEISISADIEEDDVPFDDPVQVKIPSKSLVPATEKKEEKKKKKPDYSDYQFPDLDFLAKEESSADENIQAEIQENADKLIETLASFGVTASIKGVDRGPRITRYEVVPAKGVKVSQIMNLQDDIALNLAAGSIRMEAPIPGKSAVGIEIPNKKSSIVRLRDLLETPDFEGAKSKTFVCIGRDVAGQPVFGDLAKMPHLLIAGATGMGKSVCINSLLISVLYKARPDEVKLIMIDPKQVEFTMYNGIPHLLVPVVSDAKQAAGALMWAVEEMERRYNLLNPLCVRNVEAYNEKVTADPSLGEPLPKIIIVIDEFADLMLQVKDPVESLVTRIAQKARAAGIHLVIGTQRPSVNVITGVIKANVPSRISCKVMSNVDSKTVLDSAGAEKLLDKGDALYAPSGSPKPHRLQCAFVADGEVETIMNFLKQNSDGNSYDSTVMEDIERAAQRCNKKGGGNDRDDSDSDGGSGEGYLNDRQFLDAVEVAVNTRKISTSLIQRKLSIGYGKAAKFIDIMEDMGIVGEANGQRPREVLLTPDEWREKLARATLD